MSLGESIHDARKAAGLSQEALGEKLGVVSQTVSKWERGESAPDAAALPALADALGLSLDALFGREPTERTLEEDFLRLIGPMTPEERSELVLRLQRRSLEQSVNAAGIRSPNLPQEVRYAYLGKSELSFYRSHPDCPAAFIFREPAEGWSSLFREPEKLRLLWEAVGDGETLRAAHYILSHMPPGIVEREALGAMLGLEHPEETIRRLRRLGLLYGDTRTVDGAETEVLFFTPEPSLLALLTLAKLLFDRNSIRNLPEIFISGGRWTLPPMVPEDADTELSLRLMDLW